MSKITLEPNNSGTGTFTIAAPNSNTNRTLTLPDEAGTALTDTTDLEPQVKTATNATGSAPIYACRAWVNFDADGTVSIRESGNISSITDNGTGNYTGNFATSMPDVNYAGMGMFTWANNGNQIIIDSYNTNNFRILTLQNNDFAEDVLVTAAIFR